MSDFHGLGRPTDLQSDSPFAIASHALHDRSTPQVPKMHTPRPRPSPSPAPAQVRQPPPPQQQHHHYAQGQQGMGGSGGGRHAANGNGPRQQGGYRQPSPVPPINPQQTRPPPSHQQQIPYSQPQQGSGAWNQQDQRYGSSPQPPPQPGPSSYAQPPLHQQQQHQYQPQPVPPAPYPPSQYQQPPYQQSQSQHHVTPQQQHYQQPPPPPRQQSNQAPSYPNVTPYPAPPHPSSAPSSRPYPIQDRPSSSQVSHQHNGYLQPGPPSAPPPLHQQPPGRSSYDAGHGRVSLEDGGGGGRRPGSASGQNGAHREQVSNANTGGGSRSSIGEAELWAMFSSMDINRSGQLAADEVQQLLAKDSRWQIKPREDCVKMLMNIFDTDRSGSISYPEFEGLYRYIKDWHGIFERFDRDRSGTIDRKELEQALQSFGYPLPPDLVKKLEKRYVPPKAANGDTPRGVTFDRFLMACVTVKHFTEAFRRRDVRNEGKLTLDYSSFMDLVLDAPS